MADRPDEAANEVISGMNQRMGLRALRQVPIINEMYWRLSGKDFYNSTIGVLNALIGVAEAHGLIPIVKEHTARLVFARSMLSMLERELQRTPIPTTPLDADSKTWHDPETGQSYVVVGGGPQEGGYAMGFNSGDPRRW